MKTSSSALQSLDSTLLTLGQALRNRDSHAARGACDALARQLPSVDSQLRRWGVHPADLDDVRQELNLKIMRSLPRLHEPLRHPSAWVRRVARCVAVDWVRRERRLPRSDFDLDQLPAPETAAEPASNCRAVLGGAVHAYALRARAARRPREHQIRAWYQLRIQKLPACEVAASLRSPHRHQASVEVIWQWARRGQALVLQLAARDENPARAALLRRAVAAECGERARS